MLLSLDVNNFALIDELYIEFEQGLNIITGETGAGKSIVVDALNFVLGARFTKDIVKKGEDTAKVKGMFELSQKQADYIKSLDLECDETIVSVERTLTVSGKSVCRYNNKIITLSALKEIAFGLMEIHGQHENQILLDSKNHIDFLDAFAFKKSDKEKEEFGKSFNAFKDLRNKILSDKMDEKTIKLRLATVKDELKGLDTLKWQAGEEQALKDKIAAMENVEQIMSAVKGSYNLLYGENESALTAVKQAVKLFDGITSLNEEYKAIHKNLSDIYFELENTVSDIRDEKSKVTYSPQKLEEMQKRLFAFSSLCKKYATDENGILEYTLKLKREKSDLENNLLNAGELKEQLKGLYKNALVCAEAMSKKRACSAGFLEKEMKGHLLDLGMKNAEFKVLFQKKDFSSKGIDDVEFLFCANKGQDLKPLAKVASGGEISRLMLAFKNIDIDSAVSDGMVFDEIDTGISGKTATAVADKLANIAKSNQVICVTHLPQVASKGNNNLFVSKTEVGETVKVCVTKLDEDGKINEIARLISGNDITATGIEHAKKLISEK